MISDNASTYLAMAEELRKLLESDTLKEALAYQNITWHFIPKRAPWYGGFWQHLIGLTKQAVKNTCQSICHISEARNNYCRDRGYA